VNVIIELGNVANGGIGVESKPKRYHVHYEQNNIKTMDTCPNLVYNPLHEL
jgi:hypothetical protein